MIPFKINLECEGLMTLTRVHRTRQNILRFRKKDQKNDKQKTKLDSHRCILNFNQNTDSPKEVFIDKPKTSSSLFK